MDKESLELFKRAISEGVSNRFDKMSAGCTEEILYSEKHKLAMRTIVYGKAEKKRAWSPRMRRIIAILVAAAILLTSCGIIFRNEIREVFEELYVSLTYGEHGKEGKEIEEIYALGYVPEGYTLEKETDNLLLVRYTYVDEDNNVFIFEQSVMDGMIYIINSEAGYSDILQINGYDVYYRFTGQAYNYVWDDGKYCLSLTLTAELSVEEITFIINGITTK